MPLFSSPPNGPVWGIVNAAVVDVRPSGPNPKSESKTAGLVLGTHGDREAVLRIFCNAQRASVSPLTLVTGAMGPNVSFFAMWPQAMNQAGVPTKIK